MHWLVGLDYQHWLMAGLAMLVLDLVVRSTLLMWTGLAVLLTGLLTLLLPFAGVHLSWFAQLMLFSGLMILLLLGWLMFRTVDKDS